MTDPYLKSLLGEDEKIILETRQHWFVLLRSMLVELIIFLIIIAVVSMIMFWLLHNTLVAIGYGLAIIPIVFLFWDVLVWANQKYVVTNWRVFQINGVINKNVIDSSLEKVNDVKLEQSFWGRIFDYGNVEILTASEQGINLFTRILAPIRFKTAMINAKEKLENSRRVYDNRANLSVPQLIEELNHLHQQGVLTEEEFQLKKADLLKRL